jgi:hypothetical protein
MLTPRSRQRTAWRSFCNAFRALAGAERGLSNDVSVSVRGEETPNSNGGPPAGHETGILADLPRTRPQHSSARRDAARRTRTRSAEAQREASVARKGEASAARKAAPEAETAAASAGPVAAVPQLGPDRRAKPRPDRPGTRPDRPGTHRPRSTSRIRIAEEPVPRQGFECEGEHETGSVQPPGATELIGVAAEMLGELARAGIATGERLLKDVRSLLPRS